MVDKTLLKLAIVISVTGILILFLISKIIELKPIDTSRIDETYIGKTVFVNGTIKTITVSNRTMFTIVNSSLPFIVFSKVELDKGAHVLVTGKVGEFKGDLQVVVDKIQIE